MNINSMRLPGFTAESAGDEVSTTLYRATIGRFVPITGDMPLPSIKGKSIMGKNERDAHGYELTSP